MRGASRRSAAPAGEIAIARDGKDITRGFLDPMQRLYPLRDRRLRGAGGTGSTYGGFSIYENMLADDRVHSTFLQRRSAVVARELEVLPGDNRRDSKRAAEFLVEALEHCGWDHITNLMLYGVFYGYSVAECIWARDGAHVFPEAIRVRDRKRFVFDQEFKPLLVTHDDPQGEPLPERKFWTFSTGADHDDEPYGLGLGWHLYWPVWFKRNQVKFWLTYLDKHGMPTAVGKYGASATEDEIARLLQAARALHSNSAVTIPDSMILELLQAKGGGGQIGYEAFYQRMQSAITTAVLSQTMTTDDGSSLSQASVHMEVRKEVVEADDALVSRSFMRGPARWLRDWNFPNAAVPIVRRVMDDPPDTLALAERDKHISEMRGAFEDDYVEQIYNVRLAPQPDPAAEPVADVDMAEAPGEFGSGPSTGDIEKAVGPAIDRWSDRLRERAWTFGSLEDYLAWLDTDASTAIDVAPAARSLARALAAAHLAGRYDVEGEHAEFAEEDGARLLFAEQIRFFLGKLGLTTVSWTDIWQSEHDRAFVVAGAAKEDLLEDLRGAVQEALEGETIETFRKRFDEIVATHGWSYRGGRNWRTRVIYDTNRRSSYAAGRYRQMKAIASRRPYWRYRHSHASVQPRDQHLAWDGMVLRHDDPWWDMHYPPNGWGCKCYVEALTEEDLAALGKDGPDAAPVVRLRTVTVGTTGPNPRTVEVPEGIDPGWAYAPGQSPPIAA